MYNIITLPPPLYLFILTLRAFILALFILRLYEQNIYIYSAHGIVSRHQRLYNRAMRDSTLYRCCAQHLYKSFESNLSAFPADFKLYRRAMARLNIVQSRRATTTTIIIHYQL